MTERASAIFLEFTGGISSIKKVTERFKQFSEQILRFHKFVSWDEITD